jgi:hypothetical protein
MSVTRYAAINIAGAGLAVHPVHFICTTTAELPSSAMKLGDTAIALDTNVIYKAASTSTWTAADTASNYSATVTNISGTYIATDRTGSTISSGTSAQNVINAAIDAVTTQGGYVFIAAGEYLLTAPIIVKDGVGLVGEGNWGRDADGGAGRAEGTVIRADASALTKLIEFDSAGHQMRIENIALDCDPASGTNATCGIYVRSGETRVINCGVINATGYGILCDVRASGTALITPSGTAAASANTVAVQVSHCMTVDNAIGIYIAATLSDCDIIGNRVLGSSGTAGIYLDGGGAQVIDNHITTNTSGSTSSLTLASSNAMVMGNYFDHVNLTTGTALVNASGTNRSTIQGNYFTDPPTSKPCILAAHDFRGSISGNTYSADGGNSFVQSNTSAFSNTAIMGNFGRKGIASSPNWVSEVIGSTGTVYGSMSTPYALNNNYFAGNGSYLG